MGRAGETGDRISLPAPETRFRKHRGRAAKTASRWKSRKAGKRALRYIFLGAACARTDPSPVRGGISWPRAGNTLPPKSGSILAAVLYRGELPRADAAGVVGVGERHARRIVSALVERGVLASQSPRAPLRLVFPAALASRWMPGLFPEKHV